MGLRDYFFLRVLFPFQIGLKRKQLESGNLTNPFVLPCHMLLRLLIFGTRFNVLAVEVMVRRAMEGEEPCLPCLHSCLEPKSRLLRYLILVMPAYSKLASHGYECHDLACAVWVNQSPRAKLQLAQTAKLPGWFPVLFAHRSIQKPLTKVSNRLPPFTLYVHHAWCPFLPQQAVFETLWCYPLASRVYCLKLLRVQEGFGTRIICTLFPLVQNRWHFDQKYAVFNKTLGPRSERLGEGLSYSECIAA